MSAGMPELGSKISLISKADIRYEGRLFTVDPQECTIALANVRSFGTEDRETQFPVAPQNQVYEYILFRGSDIKDIRVVNNVSTIPNDPAIVQMTVQPSLGQPPYQPQPGFNHPMMGQMGPMGGQYGGGYAMGGMGAMGPVMGLPGAGGRDPRVTMNKQPSELGLGSTEAPNVVSIPNSIAPGNVDQIQKDQSLEDGVLDLISGGSRSITPTISLMTRKSPTMDQGTQVGHQQQQQRSNNTNAHKPANDKPNPRTIQPPYRDRESHGSGRTGSGMSQYSDGKRDNREKQDVNHLQGHGHPPGPNHAAGHPQANRGNRGGWIARGNIRGRGRGGRGGGSFRPPQPGSINNKPKNTLKFENDYDFEQANTEFEELRSQLAKTKIDNGTDNEKKDDSGNETGAGEGEPEEETDVVHYDKSKSFFDNISCEAVERSKGRSQRTDWRTERKLNSETFGVASTRRGGFRGRGYYNRGMGGGMYRGNTGYRGGYRGGSRGGGGGGNGGGNRQGNNQQQQQHQQQQQQQQQKVITNHNNQNRPNNQQQSATTAQSQNSVVTGTA